MTITSIYLAKARKIESLGPAGDSRFRQIKFVFLLKYNIRVSINVGVRESITIYPKDEKQKSLLKSLMEEMKVRFEIANTKNKQG